VHVFLSFLAVAAFEETVAVAIGVTASLLVIVTAVVVSLLINRRK
jgi:hypothetical protein